MSETIMENLCRLCLKDSFLHANIFVDRLPDNSLIYKVLNYVYDLEISVDDGLLANICRPCFWKLREFELYKKNVHQAKSVIRNIGKDGNISFKEEGEEMVFSHVQYENHKLLQREVYESSPDVPEEGMMMGEREYNACTTEISVKEEVEELVIRDRQDVNHQELEWEMYESSAVVPEKAVLTDKDGNNACTTEVMQKSEWNHVVDGSNPQSSNSMKYVNCARHEEELNLVSFQYVHEYVAQEEEGKIDIQSTCERRDSECENVEMMASKEVVKDRSNIRKKEVVLQTENYRRKEIKVENEEGLREMSIVKRATEKMCLISEREDGLKCHHCGHQKETKEEMLAHIQVMHGFANEEDKDPKNKLTNDNCREEMCKGDLGEHSAACGGRKRHVSNISGKRFTHNKNRKSLGIQGGEQLYKCSICDYKCKYNGNIKKHMRIHSGEKPFKCSICNSKFIQSGDLKRHIRIHTGEKPFKCTMCDYRAAQSGDVRRHMRIHSRHNAQFVIVNAQQLEQLLLSKDSHSLNKTGTQICSEERK